MRTLGQGLRTNLIGVDLRAWCYCGEYIAYTWNRLPRSYSRAPEYNGLAPNQARMLRGKTPVNARENELENFEVCSGHLRRFGCLAYVMVQPRESLLKLRPKYARKVFLGYRPKTRILPWLLGTLNALFTECAGDPPNCCDQLRLANGERKGLFPKKFSDY